MANLHLSIRVPADLMARMERVCGRQPDGTVRSKASVLIDGGYLRMDELEAGLGQKQTSEQMLRRKDLNNAHALRKR